MAARQCLGSYLSLGSNSEVKEASMISIAADLLHLYAG